MLNNDSARKTTGNLSVENILQEQSYTILHYGCKQHVLFNWIDYYLDLISKMLLSTYSKQGWKNPQVAKFWEDIDMKF